MTFTAVYMAVPEGYIGFVEEIPGALTEQALEGKDVEREPFEMAS